MKRRITAVRIIPLNSSARDRITLGDAINFVEGYEETAPTSPQIQYWSAPRNLVHPL